MSANDPSVSILELMKLEMDKFQNMKREMAKVVKERDKLKKEVEDLTLKKLKYKTKAREWKAMATSLPNSAGIPPPPTPADPIPLSKKRTRKEDECISGTKEADDHTCTDSGIERRSVQPKSFQLYGTTYQIPPIINKIKTSLRKEHLEKFQQSCFGHLLGIGELKIQGQLLFQLLMHMDMAASNKECLVFNINNTRVEFGAREFCLITGLRLGTSKAATAAITSSLSVQEKVFMGKYSILMKDVEDQFLNVSRFGNDRGDMPVKLALLYFLYGIFLGGNYQSKQVDQQYLPLIADLEAFNAFPWGRVAFEFLASSMLSAQSRLDDSKGTCTKPSYTIYGFSAALQIWAYEVMPSLAAYCADRANNSDDQIPRILRWSTQKKKIWFRDLKKYFTPDDAAHSVLDGITASPRELEALTTGTTNIPSHPIKERSPSRGEEMSLAAAPTTHTIPLPKKETMLSIEGQILSHAVNVPTHLRACVVQAVMQRQPPLVGRCPPSAVAEVVILSDSDSDDDEAAAANSQSKDSVDELTKKLT